MEVNMEDLIPSNDFMTKIKDSMYTQMIEETEKAIKKFCKEKGYKVETPEDFIEIQNELKNEHKFIRCEIFTKLEGNTAISTVITFIDSIEYPLSRKEICIVSGLSQKGYFY